MHKSDTTIAAKIKKGNSRALKRLYEQYHRQLYYIAKKYLKSDELAEDAVQDVFLKIWAKRQNLDPTSSIKGLLFTILKNHVLNMVRDEKKRKEIIEEVKQTAEKKKSRAGQEEKIIYAEYKDALKRAMNRLSPAKREVFKMRSAEGLSNGEIAKKRNVSKNTVKTQYYLGSKEVRNYLKKHAGLLTFILMLFGL